jgi:hypothetical protein
VYEAGVNHGVSHALAWAWEMLRAAQDIALLTGGEGVVEFLGIALQEAELRAFPLTVSFDDSTDDEQAGT